MRQNSATSSRLSVAVDVVIIFSVACATKPPQIQNLPNRLLLLLLAARRARASRPVFGFESPSRQNRHRFQNLPNRFLLLLLGSVCSGLATCLWFRIAFATKPRPAETWHVTSPTLKLSIAKNLAETLRARPRPNLS